MLRYYLARPVHISWLIAGFGLMLVVGVSLAPLFEPAIFASIAWLITALILFAIAGAKPISGTVTFALLGGLSCGLWRGSIELHQLAIYHKLVGINVVASGTISEDPDLDARGNLLLRLKDLTINDHRVAGKLWVATPAKSTPERSDRVTVKGVISEGFGSFPATMYEPEIVRIERPTPGDVALHVRDWFAGLVRQVISEPEASLGIGYLVGQRRSLPSDLENALKITGLTHVIVASGYNLTILVRLARRLFEKFSKYLATLSAAMMIMAFVAITGASPSMSRAGLVAGLSLAAWYYGRKFHPLVLLPLAASVTVLINPSYAWNDLGWELSFAAFAGVMILAPIAQRYFFGDKKPGTIRQILGETVTAQVATLPLLIVTFGYVSNVAVAANLLVLPLVPLAMLLTFISGLGALLLPFAAHVIALPASWLLEYMVAVAKFLSSQPWATTNLEVGGWFIGLFYLMLVVAMVAMKRSTDFSLRDSNIVE